MTMGSNCFEACLKTMGPQELIFSNIPKNMDLGSNDFEACLKTYGPPETNTCTHSVTLGRSGYVNSLHVCVRVSELHVSVVRLGTVAGFRAPVCTASDNTGGGLGSRLPSSNARDRAELAARFILSISGPPHHSPNGLSLGEGEVSVGSGIVDGDGGALQREGCQYIIKQVRCLLALHHTNTW